MILHCIILLSLGAFMVLLSKFISKAKHISLYLSCLTIVLSFLAFHFKLGLFLFLPDASTMLVNNDFTWWFAQFILVILLMIIISGYDSLVSYSPKFIAEYLTIILFSAIGMITLIASKNLVMLFIGLEIMLLSYYILSGIMKKDVASNEASLKYLLMGGFSSAILLMGIVLFYGAYQTFDMVELGRLYKTHVLIGTDFDTSNTIIKNQTLMILGAVFLMVGFAFKIGATPFHFWSPDVYQGAPTPITLLMVTVVKTASVVAFFKICTNVFTFDFELWRDILSIFAVLSLIVGNLSALVQKNMKRMMAYSSISHVGFILLIFITPYARETPTPYIIYFYLLAYSLASILIFNVIMSIQHTGLSLNIDTLKGMIKHNKPLAAFLFIGLLSMAGIPGTAGFIAKFYVFFILIYHKMYALMIIGILCAFIGVYYYIRLGSTAVISPENTTEIKKITMTKKQYLINIIVSIAIIVLGFYSKVI